MQRYTVHFSGYVQGVGFRYTAVNVARRYSVAGYVQNLPDGRVKLVAEGEAQELDSLIRDITGRMGRYVSKHSIDRTPATGQFGNPAPGQLTIRF